MKSLVTVLSLLCASQMAYAQMAADPCAGLPGGTGFANDYSSCEAYFSCINGYAFPVKCPAPFRFNPYGEFGPICDWPQKVECRQCPRTGTITIPDPYHCTRYRQCVNGIAMERECSPGTAFDANKGMCVIDAPALCDHVNTCGRLEGGTGNAPSTQFCNQFIVCYNGEKFGEPMNCPQGLMFDSKNNRCALEADAVCYPGSISSINGISRISAAMIPLAPTRHL